MKQQFLTQNKKIIYENPWIKFIEFEILRRGKKGICSVIERKDCALIIPVTDSQKTILLKQYRYPTDSESWEFPMGAIEANETPFKAAKRELKEETGINIKQIKKIGEFFPIPGLTPQKVFVYIVKLKESQLKKIDLIKEDEILDVKIVPIKDIQSMIRTKKITDGFTLCSLDYLTLYLKDRLI